HTSQLLKVPINKTCTLKFWKTKKQDLSTTNLIKFKEYLKCLTFSKVYEAIKTVTIHTNKKTKWLSRGIKLCSKKQRQLLWVYRLNPNKQNRVKYGVVFWGQSTNREFVFKLQKRCIRAIYGIKKTDSCVPYFKKSKILTLPALYILETAIFVKNNLNLFKKMADVKKIPIRSQYLNTLCNLRCKTSLYKKSFFGVAPQVYNKIPDTIKKNALI
ncbi:hypothetical protein SFRURICE_002469, partial [Spodoptera frugiperda]